jgi:hypothetical protein
VYDLLYIFYVIFYLIFTTKRMSHLKKFAEKIQFSLIQSDNNDGYFIKRDKYIYDNISPNSFFSVRNFSGNFLEKIKAQFMLNTFFCRKSYHLWCEVEKCARARQAADCNIIRRKKNAICMLGN